MFIRRDYLISILLGQTRDYFINFLLRLKVLYKVSQEAILYTSFKHGHIPLENLILIFAFLSTIIFLLVNGRLKTIN